MQVGLKPSFCQKINIFLLTFTLDQEPLINFPNVKDIYRLFAMEIPLGISFAGLFFHW